MGLGWGSVPKKTETILDLAVSRLLSLGGAVWEWVPFLASGWVSRHCTPDRRRDWGPLPCLSGSVSWNSVR